MARAAAWRSAPSMDVLGINSWRFCVVILISLLFDKVKGQGSAVQSYPVDWSVVPITAPTTSNLTANCKCDLLTVGCSFGCCCDSKCSDDLTNFFESEGICLPSGTEQQTLKFCVPDSFVFKVRVASGVNRWRHTIANPHHPHADVRANESMAPAVMFISLEVLSTH
jgi:hypothetical protein